MQRKKKEEVDFGLCSLHYGFVQANQEALCHQIEISALLFVFVFEMLNVISYLYFGVIKIINVLLIINKKYYCLNNIFF